MIRLLTDEALRLRMRRKALERCRTEFEIGGAATRLAEYYESLLGRTPLAEAVFAGHGKLPVQ